MQAQLQTEEIQKEIWRVVSTLRILEFDNFTVPLHTELFNASFKRNYRRSFMIVGGRYISEGVFAYYFKYDGKVFEHLRSKYWVNIPPDSAFQNCSDIRMMIWIIFSAFASLAALCIIAFFIRSRFLERQMSKGPNKILLLQEDLVFIKPRKSLFESSTKSTANDISNNNDILQSVSSLRTIRSEILAAGKTATFNGDIVWVKSINVPNFTVKGKMLKEFRMLRDLRNENVNPFLGCYISPDHPSLIFEYGNRGSLEDIIRKEEIKLDWNFKWSMLNDLVRGMRYLHNSPVKHHGMLKSRNCVVDSRWVLKITDYGLLSITNYPNKTYNLPDLLWTAPEHLRNLDMKGILTASQPGDVYSFGIVLQEVILRSPPFSMLNLTAKEIIAKIKKPPPLLRPSVSKQAAPPEYINIMKECWAEQIEIRPTFEDLVQRIKILNGGKKVNIVDAMFRMLEQYSNNLEDLINQRTLQLEEEKKKTEKLLSEMLPAPVSESLKLGKPVDAESFECVTIYFSDIVGFTTISALSEPMQVVNLLNDLYTMFDSIVMRYDCYKVETIGDAYMVVSGLPIRNGNRHAAEIATMALDLLHNCGKFRIKHMPGVPLRIRVGIHSGACVAGVVGLKMPRYCLFGDTVNTASRLESTSQAYRIHVSQSTATILQEIGGFRLESRGEIELKGKGKHQTYWLVGKDGFDKELPQYVNTENNHGLDLELVKLAEQRTKSEELSMDGKSEKLNSHANPSAENRPNGFTSEKLH